MLEIVRGWKGLAYRFCGPKRNLLLITCVITASEAR